MKFEVLFGTVVVIALIVVLGIMTLGNIGSTQTANSSEYNATEKGITALTTYSNFLFPIALIVIVIFIVSVLLHFSKTTGSSV